jgi:dolichol-phosphate mannosyltransferase
MRRFISQGGSLYTRIVLGMKIRDFTGGFNAWRRETLTAIDLDDVRSKGFAFQIEMKFRASRLGFRLAEVPIVFPDRTAGKSKMSKGIFFEALLRVWQIRFSVRQKKRLPAKTA